MTSTVRRVIPARRVHTVLAYLATPYTRWRDGPRAAFECACEAAGRLIEQGHNVYSPIIHTHAIAEHCGMDLYDHARWMKLDEAMMKRCDELWIVQMAGWQESKGIAMERAYFEKAGKSIRFVRWPTVELDGKAG